MTISTPGVPALLSRGVAEWRREVDQLSLEDRAKLREDLDALTQRAARLAAYVARREGDADNTDARHAYAVARSNTLTRRVRRALGFTYPDASMTF